MHPVPSQSSPRQISDGYRMLIAIGAFAGALGIGAAASTSHGESRNLSAIASICLAHGPTLVAIGLAGSGRVFFSSAALLASGTILFALDLGAREWLAHGLFTGAAPLGGLLMILGWLMLVVAAAFGARTSK